MVGRYINPSAKMKVDDPVFRFGNLATLPEKWGWGFVVIDPLFQVDVTSDSVP